MGSLWMLVASLLFACMGACVKLGAARFNAAELVFWRGFVSLVLIGAWVAWRRLPVMTPMWRTHLARSGSGFIALVLYFLAIITLPLAAAVTLNYTSPLWLAALVAVLAHEPLRRSMWGALALGLAGVAMVLKPSIDPALWYGAVFGMCSGALSSVAYLNVRKLGEAGEPEWRTVFWFSAVCAAGGLPFALFKPHSGAWTLADALILLGVGGFGALAQLAMTRAYRFGKTMVAAALSYATVVFAAVFGVVLWNERLDPLAYLGIVAVIASGALAGQISRRPAPPAETD
ncbi:DMT family transporter [Niveibacterium umoris]|uniref:Drug/metabolite transporter (DMT)-like permease n=1 Tax=Niveibacterium umoris TaxID=1193620 RepID=A0A840BNP8_9RHOO|nr:DMT family transporter [Niveibacterium umoris]MBB4014935.1 drug/metabolite transporter (DMT)-like permease [Niveibacterium umoris]